MWTKIICYFFKHKTYHKRIQGGYITLCARCAFREITHAVYR